MRLIEAYRIYRLNRFKRKNEQMIYRTFVRIFGYAPTQIALDAFAEVLFDYKGDLRVTTPQ